MSNHAFDQAMSQIVAEAEVAGELERRMEARRRVLAKVRRAASYLGLTAILACGFFYRVELQKLVAPVFDKVAQASPAPKVDEKTGAALNGIQASAAKRDAAMENILAEPNKR